MMAPSCRWLGRAAALVAFALTGLTAAACNDSRENESGTRPEPDASTPSLFGVEAGAGVATTTVSGFSLKPFSRPSTNPGPRAVLLTVSGEALATQGFAFPPEVDQEVTFVDGWALKFDRLLVTVDAITLAQNPDTDPNNPTSFGAVVARADGPWAVDLSRNDASTIAAKGSGRAVALATLERQNVNGGAPFDTTGTRYALGYRTTAASANAINVNLGAAALADYESMVKEGCSLFYVGTAEWKGDASCSPPPGANAALDALPKRVSFRLCFKAPSDYVNCQNPDNDPASALAGEDHLRGVAFKDNTFVVAQATVHTDHSFWSSVEEDSPAVFDGFAAAATTAVQSGDGGDGGAIESATLTMRELENVDYQSVRSATGAPLPWRNCVGSAYSPLDGNVSFFSGSVQNVGVGGNPQTGLRHLADYVTYTTSTQGHMNADGFCFVKRNYTSPN